MRFNKVSNLDMIPTVNALSAAIGFIKDGYTFIGKRCTRYNIDVFQLALPGKNVICMTGEEAARVFYNPDRFVRNGAIPKAIQDTLLGRSGVQTLDGTDHYQRKEMFMSLMSGDNINKLLELISDQWVARITKWKHMKQVNLFEETQQLLCVAVCVWAGVPLESDQVRKRAQQFEAMVDGFGSHGLSHWRARNARKDAEDWIGKVVEQVRAGHIAADNSTALGVMALHHDGEGHLMPPQVAAVEVINVLRPVVAISTYITFAALALHRFPLYRQKLREDFEGLAENFVHEVRRFYPFGPFLGARVRNKFVWNGVTFDQGMLVLLDIYGTNHDPRIWNQPDAFKPERFNGWDGNPFSFIPQGGGDYHTGHRCPGERITIAVTKLSLKFLTSKMKYHVPKQNLTFSLSRIPTFPKSGFVITDVTPLNT